MMPGRLRLHRIYRHCFFREAASEAASATTTTEAAGEGTRRLHRHPIKIGGIGPVTGGAAIYSQAVKNAEELAVKEINAANGSDVFGVEVRGR